MTAATHPSDETLLRHAAGTLPAGPKLLVHLHLAACPHCRERVAVFEAVGGALLEEIPPEPLAGDALARALSRIKAADAPAPAAAVPRPLPPPSGLVLPQGIALPAPLAARRIGPLRPVAPGVRMGRVYVPEDPDTSVRIFRIEPGRSIPRHTHIGTEYTHVICGGFSDPLGHYGPGDLVEADAEVEHTPKVDDDGECVCIAAFEGRLRFSGLLGWVLRPFF